MSSKPGDHGGGANGRQPDNPTSHRDPGGKSMTDKKPWDDVEAELLETVFYAHDPSDVRAADDLARKGMLDSLSIVAILEVLIDATGNEDDLENADATDFRNLAQIRALYERA